MIKNFFVLLLLLPFVHAGDGCSATHNNCTEDFTSGCDVRTSWTMPAGTHNLPDGIDICGVDITLNCGGATLEGTGTAISIADAGATISNCNIKNYGTGISKGGPGTSDTTLIQNTIENVNTGITITGENNILTDNTILNATGIPARGIIITGDNNELTGNFLNDTGSAITITGDNNELTNNILNEFGGGIDITGDINTLTNNNISDNPQTTLAEAIEITGSDSSLTTNTISNVENGIIIIGNSTIISNNEITTQGTGVEIQGVGHTVATNNISNNIIGIDLQANETTITNNNLDLNVQGIFLTGNTNIITDNSLNNGQEGIIITGDNNSITSNTANNGNTGFEINTASGNILTGNTANDNTEYGIALFDTVETTILGNTLQENMIYDLYFDTEQGCDHTITDNTGSGNRPIIYANSETTIENTHLAQLILCEADNTVIRNITIEGSFQHTNNDLLIVNTNNAILSTIVSSENHYGIRLSGTNNELTEIIANENELNGISIFDNTLSTGNTISGSRTNRNGEVGIFAATQERLTLIDNIARENTNGFQIVPGLQPINITAIRNTAIENQINGIDIGFPHNGSLILNNTAINNRGGNGIGASIIFEDTEENVINTVSGNIVSSNFIGLSLIISYAAITENIAANNTFSGIEVIGSNNYIKENNIQRNEQYGLIVSGNFNNISDNIIEENGEGILLGLVRNNNYLIGNHITNNTGTGFDPQGAANLIIQDNVFTDNEDGMDLSGITNSTVHLNKACFNKNIDIIGVNIIGTNNTCEVTDGFMDIGFDRCQHRCPVVFIPGITGSELLNNGELIWTDIPELISDIDDDFLDVLRLDETGENPLNPGVNIEVGDIIDTVDFTEDVEYERLIILHPITNIIIAAGKAKHALTGPSHVYDLLFEKLEEEGYEKDISLFHFPYDWRMDNRDTAQKLEERLDEITNTTGITKVNIVAHSMGGLITREFMRNNTNRINKFIMIGTPNQGAPPAYDTIQFGRTFSSGLASRLVLNPKKLKELTTNFSSSHQLLPSQQFLSAQSWIFNDQFGTVEGELTTVEETYLTNEDSRLENQLLATDAIIFQNDLGTSMEGNASIIIGSGHKTFLRLTKSEGLFGREKYKPEFTNGDGTVPDISASTVDNTMPYYVNEEHGPLSSSGEVPTLVVQLLNDSTITFDDDVRATPFPAPKGTILLTHAPTQLIVYDEEGNVAGNNLLGGVSTTIPGSDYFTFGETKAVYIPENTPIHAWVLSESAGNDFFDLDIAYDDELGTITNERHFEQVPITPESTAYLFHDEQNLTLRLDYDGDGILESVVLPEDTLQAELINESGNTITLRFDPISESYKDDTAVNPNALLRLRSGEITDLENRFVGVVYKAGDETIRVDSSPLLTAIGNITLEGDVYKADTDLDFNGTFPGIGFAVLSTDNQVSPDDTFLRIDPLNGWFKGADSTPDAFIPNFDAFEVVVTNTSNTYTITVTAAYDDVGNEILKSDELLIGIGFANETFTTFDEVKTQINTGVNFTVPPENLIIYVNGLAEGSILQNLPDIALTSILLTPNPYAGQEVKIAVETQNIGTLDAPLVNIDILINNELIGFNSVSLLENTTNLTEFTWIAEEGINNMSIFVNQELRAFEQNNSNNEAHFSFTVSPNAPPMITNLPDTNLSEDSGSTTIIFLPDFAQDNETPSENLTYNILNQSNSSIVFCEININSLECTTQPDAYGNSEVTIEVSDEVSSDTDTLLVQVLPVNDPPVLLPLQNMTIVESEVLLIQPIAFDVDNDPLTFSTNARDILQSPFRFNETTGMFQWRAPPGSAGAYILGFKVSDGAIQDTQLVSITVLE